MRKTKIKSPEQQSKTEIDAFLQSLTNPQDLKRVGYFPMSMWGRDHWSLLAYLGCRNADNNSIVDYDHFRVNEQRHPFGRRRHSNWQESYGTRLKGFQNEDKTENPNLRIGQHDDFDVLHDLECEGLVTTGTVVSGYVSLTEKGRKLEAKIRAHKQTGGSFATFAP